MSLNFMSLPREIRDLVYEATFPYSETICPWLIYNPRETLTPGLLQASKTVHTEASFFLYSHNCFDFSEGSAEDVSSFLEQIGLDNAACIRQIRIDFPQFQHLDAGNFELDDDSIKIFKAIQSVCTNLTTVTTSLRSSNAAELWLDALDSPNSVAAALGLVDSHFVAIPSLQKTVIEVYEDGPNDFIRKQMENNGWTIKTHVVEHEELDRDFSDGGWDDYRSDSFDNFDNQSYDNDSYDIDNDSDFWRRAAD